MALSYSILIASLGQRIDDFLIPIFTAKGYHVRTALGSAEIARTLSRSLDLVLLDMPSAHELPELPPIREACPCALVVVGPQRNDKLLVAALEYGADDYIQRPFRTDELLARIRAQLRRRQRTYLPTVTLGPLMIDPPARTATYHGTPLDLSPEQFTLLAILAAQPGYPHPAGYLLEQVWGRSQIGATPLLEEAIAALRMLIEPVPAQPQLVSGDSELGYWLSAH
jgi:DNA-binding response OmpR family regulator